MEGKFEAVSRGVDTLGIAAVRDENVINLQRSWLEVMPT
jgi:hypothetical protein